MAPPYAIPRLLACTRFAYADIHLWEIHEAFAAQVLAHIKALESPEFIRDKAKVTAEFGKFRRERMNPTGGGTAIGHPFGAAGARISTPCRAGAQLDAQWSVKIHAAMVARLCSSAALRRGRRTGWAARGRTVAERGEGGLSGHARHGTGKVPRRLTEE